MAAVAASSVAIGKITMTRTARTWARRWAPAPGRVCLVGCCWQPDTINTIPERTLLAFADHGEVGELLRPDHAAAGKHIAEVVAHHVDADALAESLQRQGARAFEADWASLLDSIGAKADKLAAA
jgi:Transaldolase/Fructose-6-phosphate aldolase